MIVSLYSSVPWLHWLATILAHHPLFVVSVVVYLFHLSSASLFLLFSTVVFGVGGRVLSYGLADWWNIREAARLLRLTSGREFREIPVPDFAQDAVKVTQKNPQRLIDSILNKSYSYLRFVTVVNEPNNRKEIIPYCIYSFAAPSLVYLPYPPDGTTLFGRFQVLHEIGHATTASNWCLIQRYHYLLKMLFGGVLIAIVCNSLLLWLAWMFVFYNVLLYVTIVWYVEREMIADKFALSYMKLAGDDEAILNILVSLWGMPDRYQKLAGIKTSILAILFALWRNPDKPRNQSKNRTNASLIVERMGRLKNARIVWAVDNEGFLDLFANGYDPGKPPWKEIIPLLCIEITSGFLMPAPYSGFAWWLIGLGVAMFVGYIAVGLHVNARYGQVMDIWFQARLPGPVTFANSVLDNREYESLNKQTQERP